MNFRDLSGRKFGRWTAVKRGPNAKNGATMWACVCECGTERLVSAHPLENGKTISCGCYRVESLSKRRTHGHTLDSLKSRSSATYRSWRGAKGRCTSRTHAAWEKYGGRGIRIADRWLKFENFLVDMGERPPGTSLDRIDNDGNYEPGNCRWASTKVQARNRRTTRAPAMPPNDWSWW